MTARETSLYRAQLVRLPLQRATFADIAGAGRRLGLQGSLDARLDEEGNLYLDRELGRMLANDLVASLTEAKATSLQASLEAACEALTGEIERTPDVVGRGGSALGEQLAALALRVAEVVDFAILGRFLPDALMEGLTRAGDPRPPPFPSPSAGSHLAGDLLDLYQRLTTSTGSLIDFVDGRGRVDHQVERDLQAFADAHVGFGPLAWDRPGFEDVGQVLDAMVAAFSGRKGEDAESDRLVGTAGLPALGARPTAESGAFPVEATRRLLAAWLAFLDQETWHVRRAFFLGMAPVLRRLAHQHRHHAPELRAGDLLFCTSASQLAGDPNGWLAEAKARRTAYVQDGGYLAAYGIDEGRLDGLVERSRGST